MTSDMASSIDSDEHPAARAETAALTWRLAIFFLAGTVLFAFLTWRLSPGGFEDTVLRQTLDVLQAKSGDDSWGPMAAALAYLEEPGGKPLYSAVFFEQGIKFQYPPSALFALEGMLLFGEERVRMSDEAAFASPPVNDIIGWGFLLMTAATSAVLLETGLKRGAGAYVFDHYTLLRIALVFAFTLSFYPAIKAFTLGQIQLWINAIFAAAMAVFALGGRVASGALIGVICLLKPHYGLFALWGLINHEWRFAAACILTGVAGVLLSVWAYGWANHLDYLRVLSFMSERGEAFYANQSVNGLLNRLAALSGPGAPDNTDFNAFGFPPYNPYVYWGTFISSGVILLMGLFRKSESMNRTLAFAILAVSLTIAAPIAWEHHYGLLLPVFAFMAGFFVKKQTELAILAVCAFFVSNFIPAFNMLADTPFNVLQSYMLAGGIVLLIVMHSHLTSTERAGLHNFNLTVKTRRMT